MGVGKGRRTAVISLLGSLGALAASWPVLKDLLVEEWRIRTLGSKKPSEVVASAAALGEAGSLRAIPALLDPLKGEVTIEERSPMADLYGGISLTGWPYRPDWAAGPVPLCLCGAGTSVFSYLNPDLFRALERIGEKRGLRAASVLLGIMEAEPPDSPLLPVLVSLLGRMGPEARAALPALEKLRSSSKKTDSTLWHLAVDAIWAIQ